MEKLPRDLKPNDIYESANGNRYLVIDDHREVYIGNKDPSRNDPDAMLPRRLDSQIPVETLGRAYLCPG